MKLDPPGVPEPRKVVSPALLLSCFGICLGGAYLLIPKGDELYRLLLADGEQARVMELVVGEGAPPGEGVDLAVDAGAGPVDYQRLLEIAFDSVGGGELGSAEVERLSSALLHCDPTTKGFDYLHRNAGAIGAGDNERFYNILARRALAEGDPELAATIYTDLAERVSDLSVETVDMMVRAYRYTGQSKQASACIESLQRRLGDFGKLPREMRDSYVALLMEADRAGDAFEILRGDFDLAAGDTARLGLLLPKLVEAASFSDRGAELPPYYEAYFAALPESRWSPAELAEAARRGLSSTTLAFLGHAKRYAQICEWNERGDSAFDYYLKCAALGDGPSLERVVDLYDDLMRDAEMAQLLAVLVPVTGHPEHTLMLARLLGEEARYDEAFAIYKSYIESLPERVEGYFELAALHEERGDLELAIDLYKQASDLLPGDVDIRVRLAGLHVAFGEYDEAFALYRQLPDASHTLATLEHLLMLAEALGDDTELARAARLRFAKLVNPRADDYLDLAQAYSSRGDTAGELRVLQGATDSLPGSEVIAVELADALYRESRFDEAMRLLTRQDLRDNMEAMSLFIEICGGTDNYSYAARYLPEGIEDRFSFAPSVRIELAQIYDETGNLESAQRLYASVPEGGMAWQLLAAAKYKTGEFDRAEEYQRRYLNAAEQPDAQDWVFLGDICKNLGKEREATEAYKHSLNLLKSELRPRNASL